MRSKSSQFGTGPQSPRPTYSPQTTLAGTGVLVVALIGTMLAVSYPVGAAVAIVLAFGALIAVRAFRQLLRIRRRGGRTRRFCIPGTEVCLEA